MSTVTEQENEPQEIELQLLLEAIYRRYGYDFRSYSVASVRRRVQQHLIVARYDNICALMHDILHNGEAFSALLSNLTINVTEMFRDPDFYQAFREKVVPVLRTHPFLKVWHAGCATGEEIYSMAILLKEEGLYDRCQIYATDIDKEVLEKARRGIFPASELRRFTENYERSGGKKKLSDYYTEKYDNIIMDPALKKNVIFADHDLATDQVFGEMQVVLCRNVLIYFNKELQKHVFRLFKDSLDIAGYLCLGSKESLRFSGCADAFDIIEEKQRIYKKRM
ncbi:MAG: protein-glutamate O-methyltransferase CheR [Moraxellaceae bacterium]|nr:protein-glutamate O-methyltransferase CheR [Moraxellaceae bacterium]MBP7228815.1 protein-glutamate O-methyltransferase CheR [Moraxellaceae bacterium]MBP8852532.1 protein-glutamate O-methyltransferase CheR [Moraxellaceae bacterium]MBP9045174.1 protein-glutamate O-methyltransferase CheR [Moraxellaceae bacterium]MBP9730231.1 protein-glutamate O-methyltransferase CheR [Moraxellaceae bacterium]